MGLVSGARRLDARWHATAGAPSGGAVVAHPHPAHGGHMDHPVVVAAADRLARAGLAALRFDFRGVRRSEGRVEDADGHLADWREALRDARRRVPAGPLVAAGFSYGARALATLLRDAPRDDDPGAVLLLAPATRVPRTRRDFGHLLLGRPLGDAAVDERVLATLRALPRPAEVLVGEHDVVAPPDELRANLPPGGRLTVLAGLNHFFSRHRGAGEPAHDLLLPALDAAVERLLAATG